MPHFCASGNRSAHTSPIKRASGANDASSNEIAVKLAILGRAGREKFGGEARRVRVRTAPMPRARMWTGVEVAWAVAIHFWREDWRCERVGFGLVW